MTKPPIPYAREFFDLQVTFGRKVAEIQGVPLTDLLMEWTIIRQLLHLRVSPTTPNAVWSEYIKGVEAGDDPAAAAHALYTRRLAEGARDEDEPRYWGCFCHAYPWRGEPTVGMHFGNRDLTSHGTLSRERMPARMSELRAMFSHIREAHPDAVTVRGSSWMHNIPAYQRLFPPEYVASAEPHGHETGFWALWGQFIARDGGLRESTVRPFLANLRTQTTVDGCLRCFPYEVLKPRCDIGAFYRFYAVD
ncbi:MAG: hypothetical protein ABGY41_04030 [Candidatus Poribacteria bacterium]